MSENKNIANEPQPDYEKAEMDLLRDALKRTPTQRFDMLMQLVKTGIMLKNARVTHKPYKLPQQGN